MNLATTVFPQRGWLRDAPFDLTLIGAIAGLAFASGWLVLRWPHLFFPVFTLDLWLLGYHHVIATMTRVTFDVASFREYRYLVTWVPLLVLALSTWLYSLFGAWILTSIYLYWQWFHYTRQSYGIAQAYRRKADPGAIGPQRLMSWTIYLLPIWGILSRSYQAPPTFLSMSIKYLPVPLWLLQLVSTLVVASVLWWVGYQLILLVRGRLQTAYTIFVASHLLVFCVGYLTIKNMDVGWLVLNVWHNTQYILFVWLYNTNRFKGGLDPSHRFLSTISQPNRFLVYLGVCLAFSTAVYFGMTQFLRWSHLRSSGLSVILYSTINFHHYIVDGMVWKLRRKTVRENLGISQ